MTHEPLCDPARYSSSDIQIFIATYDRPELLKLALESVLGQSVRGMPVAVLDNGSNPDTERTVSAFAPLGVAYHASRHLGKLGNLLFAQTLADRDYVMLFHDDDQLHPDYLRSVLSVLNAHADITLVTGKMTLAPAGERRRVKSPLEPVGHLFTQREFAVFQYNSGPVFFPMAVYRTALFKRLNFPALFETYGKWLDTPLTIEAIQAGTAAFLTRSCGWYGLHRGQDSVNLDTLPPFDAWLSVEKMFLSHLGDDPATFPGLSFCIMNYRHLASGFKRRMKRTITFNDYLKVALEIRAMTPRSYRFRLLSNHLVQKLHLRLTALYYRKRERVLFPAVH